MGLLRGGISIGVAYVVYRYLTTQRDRVNKIRYIGPWLSRADPLVVVIIALLLLNVVL